MVDKWLRPFQVVEVVEGLFVGDISLVVDRGGCGGWSLKFS